MIRVGLVGFGMAGRVFHAPLISSVDGMELAAVVERSSDKAAERYPGITTYRSVEDLLKDSSIKLVVVATPNSTHYDMALQALEAGKSVVVDKPAAVTSAEIVPLMQLAGGVGLHFIPFHNRRWDSDFQTIKKVLHEESLGRLVHFESNFDRWRPGLASRAWKEDPDQGGVLLDLGTHLADQALTLFGLPEAVSADVRHERDGEGANDSFTVRMHYYRGLSVTLSANCLSSPPRPRFHLRGTKGNYLKWGLDPQEEALNKVTRIDDPHWGEEPAADWATLRVDVDGEMVTQPVPSIPGDYRLFYTGVRDALLGTAPAPVEAVAAWRAARLLEWALESSQHHREIVCDWGTEPS
jgi:scyllo-inositol 2-dehydrogenase (NADP+)